MNIRMALLGAAMLTSTHCYAGLIGTTVSLRTLAQATSTSLPVYTAFERTVVVAEPAVEYPDVASLFNPGSVPPPGFASSLVNTAINVGNDFITIDFRNTAPAGRFASGFENTYIFKFDSAALVDIVGADIDASVTNIGLAPGDLRFIGNELFVNFESLSFNPSSFARINMRVNGGPSAVPEPGTLLSVALALAALAYTRQRVKPTRRSLTAP